MKKIFTTRRRRQGRPRSGGKQQKKRGRKKYSSWREEGLRSCVRWTACRTRGPRRSESQHHLWKVAPKVVQKVVQKSGFSLFVQLFVQLLKFRVSQSLPLNWRSQLFASPDRRPPWRSQLFLHCGCCSSLSPKVWSLRRGSASAAKPHIVDPCSIVVTAVVVIADASKLGYCCCIAVLSLLFPPRCWAE